MKIVIILDESLPKGLLANSAAVLSLTLVNHYKEITGWDLKDSEGNLHKAITKIPIPILAASKSHLKELFSQQNNTEFSDLEITGFNDVAQSCRTYEEYEQKLQNLALKDIEFTGVLIAGNKEKVNKLTGSLPLLK
jgi:hypothetical protein